MTVARDSPFQLACAAALSPARVKMIPNLTLFTVRPVLHLQTFEGLHGSEGQIFKTDMFIACKHAPNEYPDLEGTAK